MGKRNAYPQIPQMPQIIVIKQKHMTMLLIPEHS
jgi:hypothetical protein